MTSSTTPNTKQQSVDKELTNILNYYEVESLSDVKREMKQLLTDTVNKMLGELVLECPDCLFKTTYLEARTRRFHTLACSRCGGDVFANASAIEQVRKDFNE